VQVNKDETATRRGVWGGAAAGAVIGILFPPRETGCLAGRRGMFARAGDSYKTGGQSRH
jgi:hypothetical protein